MTLEDWRLDEGLTYARLAELLTTPDHKVNPELARRWCLEEGQPLRRMPDPPMLRHIYQVTQGQVTPNDFAGL